MAYNDFQSKNRDNAVRDAAGRAEGKKYQFAFFFCPSLIRGERGGSILCQGERPAGGGP